MADADGVTCSSCGAPIASDDAAGFCPRCFATQTQGARDEEAPVAPSSPERGRPRRKRRLIWAVAAIIPIFGGGLWIGNLLWRISGAVAHCKRGNALSDEGKLEEATAEFRTAIRLAPDFAEAHCNLGNALRTQGKLDEAVGEYRTAIRLKPDLAMAHSNLAKALNAQGKLEEAVAEALRGDPAQT